METQYISCEAGTEFLSIVQKKFVLPKIKGKTGLEFAAPFVTVWMSKRRLWTSHTIGTLENTSTTCEWLSEKWTWHKSKAKSVFMEPSDYYDAPIDKVLHFIRSVGLIKG
jgi:hypothetical protein